MTPRIVTYASRTEMAAEVAVDLADRLRRLLADRGCARLAVPGGTTPGPMLTVLGGAELDWSKVVVTVTDERQAPADSPRSNQRLVRETLLRRAAARFTPLTTDAGSALERWALPLDIAVLGMGEDMHAASLFPGADGLARALAPDAPPVVEIQASAAGEPRLTLSARVLAAAPDRHILIFGPAKRAALDRALVLNDPYVAPVLAVLKGAIVHYAA